MNATSARERIFVGRLEISGYYCQLSSGFRELKVDHDYITYWENPYGFGGETQSPRLLSWSKRFASMSESRGRPLINRLGNAIVREALISFWALSAIVRYDAFILGFGETLLRGNVDLLLMRLLRKPSIVNMAHGSEGRPPFLDGSALIPDEHPAAQADRLATLTRKTYRRVRRIERWANYVIGAPYSNSQFARRPFVNHFALGIPYSSTEKEEDSDRINHATESNHAHKTVILHSPSNPAIKGSATVERVVNSLTQAGFQIEYRVIAGRPNSEVLNALRGCDFVVDQVYSDTPLAGFATEAAWLGRATLVAGYALSELESLIPDGMVPPSVTCRPDELETALASLLTDPQRFHNIGIQANEFVRNKWEASAVALRYLRIVHGDIPANWWVTPGEVKYVQGMGLSETEIQKVVMNMVERKGIRSLHLDHRPDLLAMLLGQDKYPDISGSGT